MKLIKASSSPYIKDDLQIESFLSMEEMEGLYSINETIKIINKDDNHNYYLHLEKGHKSIVSLDCDRRVFTLKDNFLCFKVMIEMLMTNVSVNTIETGNIDTRFYSLQRFDKTLLLDKSSIIGKDKINLIDIMKIDVHLIMLIVVLAHTYGEIEGGNKKIIKIYKIKNK